VTRHGIVTRGRRLPVALRAAQDVPDLTPRQPDLTGKDIDGYPAGMRGAHGTVPAGDVCLLRCCPGDGLL
jgi:hypothetical protein